MNSFIKYKNKRWRPKPQLSSLARKAKRHPYTGSKRFDRSYRNHGACGYCSEGRQHARARQTPIAEWDLIGAEELVLDEWNAYASPWDWGPIAEMFFDKEDELECNERLLERYNIYGYDSYRDDSYRNNWDDDPWDMWDPYGMEDWHRHELDEPGAEWLAYIHYRHETSRVEHDQWLAEFKGLEDDDIFDIITNRLNTAEIL